MVTLETLLSRSSNNMGGVHPDLKKYTLELITRCYKEGILVQCSSGFRSFEDQARLYGQGRTSYWYKGKQYGNRKEPIVTNAKPGQSVHNYGLAIDYFLVTDDGLNAIWTVNTKWKRVAEIGKSMGFEWGGDWKSFPDYPHLQYTKGLSIGQLVRGMRPAFPKLLNENKDIPKKESVRMFAPTTKTLENEMVKFLKLAHEKGILSSDEWSKKAKEGTLTLDDAVALQATVFRRSIVEKA